MYVCTTGTQLTSLDAAMQPAAVGCHLDRAVGESLGLTHSLALRLGLGLERTGTGTDCDSRFGRRSLGLTHTHTHTHTSKHGEWRQGASTLEGLGGGRSVSHWRRRGVSVGRWREGEKGYGRGGWGCIYTLGCEGAGWWNDKGGFGQFHCFGSCLSRGKGIVCLSMGVGCAGWGQRGCDKKIVDRAGSRHVESWSWTEPIFPNVPCCQRHGKT